MNKKEWIEYNNKLIGGTDRTALHDYFKNRNYEVMAKLGKLLEADDIKGGLDYMNEIVSRLSAYETFLLRLDKIETLKGSLKNHDLRISTDKDIKYLIKYEIQQLLGGKAFDKYKRDPHGLDK